MGDRIFLTGLPAFQKPGLCLNAIVGEAKDSYPGRCGIGDPPDGTAAICQAAAPASSWSSSRWYLHSVRRPREHWHWWTIPFESTHRSWIPNCRAFHRKSSKTERSP
jgi:hypothetical protein